MACDLLTPINLDKAGVGFRRLIENRGQACARLAIEHAWNNLVDNDGNFVEQFQTTGFDARLWELYLNQVFTTQRFSMKYEFSAPDFQCEIEGNDVFIEAVTTNPSEKHEDADPLDANKDLLNELLRSGAITDLHRKLHEEVLVDDVVRLAGSLFSKLQKRYWEKPHVSGKPLILAIAPFHRPKAQQISEAALMSYLFGQYDIPVAVENGALKTESLKITEHEGTLKTIPTGFFNLPEARFISGVLFSNAGTISKFSRLGKQMGDFPDIRIFRAGSCYDPNPEAHMPKLFSYEVGDGSYVEDWIDGLRYIKNPNAIIDYTFPAVPVLYKNTEGKLSADLVASKPDIFGSTTNILVIKE